MTRRIICLLLILSKLAAPLAADATASPSPGATPGPHDALPYRADEFPQWVKDLRRFEVITAGSFPFALLYTQTTYDSIRWAQNGYDSAYAPLVGTYSPSDSENKTTLLTALGVAVCVATVDFFIVKSKRAAAKRKAERALAGENADGRLSLTLSVNPTPTPGPSPTPQADATPSPTPSPSPEPGL
jgi:hypothetical protein